MKTNKIFYKTLFLISPYAEWPDLHNTYKLLDFSFSPFMLNRGTLNKNFKNYNYEFLHPYPNLNLGNPVAAMGV